jgi:YVTN family beta-propeller protein
MPRPIPDGMATSSRQAGSATTTHAATVAGYRRGDRLRTTAAGTWFAAEGPDGLPGGLLLVHPAVDPVRLSAAITRLHELGVAGVLPVQPALVWQNGRRWMVSTTAPAPTLADLLDRGPRVSLATATRVLDGLASSLAVAHRSGVVHGALTAHCVVMADEGWGLLTDWATNAAATVDDDHTALRELTGVLARHWLSDPDRDAAALLNGTTRALASAPPTHGSTQGSTRHELKCSPPRPGGDETTSGLPLPAPQAIGPTGPGPAIRERHTGRGARLLVIALLTVSLAVGVNSALNTDPARLAGHPQPAAVGQPSALNVSRPARSAASAPPASPPSVPIPALAGTLAVGPTPGFVAVAPGGHLAYVANRAAGMLTVVDTLVDQVVATIAIPAGPPQFLAFAPDGRQIYVSVFNDARSVAAVAVVDTATNSVRTTIPVRSRPFASAITPDGTRLLVPNHDSHTISVIDTVAERTIAEIPVAPNPHCVAITPDGKRAYIADHESNAVEVIDIPTAAVVAQIPVGTSPHSTAVNPVLPLAASVNYGGDSVSVIDTRTNVVVATTRVGRNPQDLAWSADGRFAYITNVSGNTVSVLDARTFAITATIPTGISPTSIAVLPDGRQALITNLDSGTLTILDLTQ